MQQVSILKIGGSNDSLGLSIFCLCYASSLFRISDGQHTYCSCNLALIRCFDYLDHAASNFQARFPAQLLRRALCKCCVSMLHAKLVSSTTSSSSGVLMLFSENIMTKRNLEQITISVWQSRGAERNEPFSSSVPPVPPSRAI